MAIHRPIDPEEEFNASISLYKSSPITFYYGSSDINDKKKVFTSILSTLASKVSLKLEDPALKSAGIIVDTPAQFMEQGGFSTLTSAIDDLKGIPMFSANIALVNVILVIGNERLLSDLERKYPDRNMMSIIKLDKSGGVILHMLFHI
jgi:polyribonucleotide 5'-hydroxyl-kinase